MGTLSTTKPSIILFSRSSNQPALIEPMHRGLKAATDIDYHLSSLAEELSGLISTSARVVLLANCLMKEDIADLYNVLPNFSARANEGTLKILVLNSIGHPRLGSLLRSRAAVEIIEMPATLKAVQYKLKSAIGGVHQSYQKAATARVREDQALDFDPSLGTKSRAARARPKQGGQEVLWQSPIEFNSDYWWIPGRKSIRNVVGVWLIDLLGPGPVVGTWEELPGVEHAGEKAWGWRPRSTAEEIFQTPDGRWVFFGKQPEFSWQKNLWSFVSKTPMFAYYAEGQNAPEFIRIEYRPEEGLLFLENSEFTNGILTRVKATFESRLGGRTGTGSEPKEEVGGNFDGWDFPVDAPERAPQKLESVPKEEGSAGWKDHTGAQGVNFKSRDLQVNSTKPKSKFRSSLTPAASGEKLGLFPVENPGVTSGGDAFDRLEIRVSLLRKNGSAVVNSPEVLLYEVSSVGSILLLRDLTNRLGDRLVLRFSLDSGETKMECTMDWELTSIDLTLEDGMLVTGAFQGGDFEPLFVLLDRLDARKKELKDFYSAARG
jgi:hypothetical protein